MVNALKQICIMMIVIVRYGPTYEYDITVSMYHSVGINSRMHGDYANKDTAIHGLL